MYTSVYRCGPVKVPIGCCNKTMYIHTYVRTYVLYVRMYVCCIVMFMQGSTSTLNLQFWSESSMKSLSLDAQSCMAAVLFGSPQTMVEMHS